MSAQGSEDQDLSVVQATVYDEEVSQVPHIPMLQLLVALWEPATVWAAVEGVALRDRYMHAAAEVAEVADMGDATPSVDVSVQEAPHMASGW